MNLLIVDDEPMALEEIREVVLEVKNDICVKCCDNYMDALENAKIKKYDVAFLDISMPCMNGLEIAKNLKDINKNTNIVFITGYSEYAVEAFLINASGYILKPAKKADVKNALDNLRIPVVEDIQTGLRIKCFGNFEVFYNDEPIKFKRTLTKEVLAYLVNLKGATATTNEICAVLFGDKSNENSSKHYFRNLISDLRATLGQYNSEDIFVYKRNSFSVDVSKINCDYYKYLNYDISAVNSYMGEYMKQYSWAELTNGFLISQSEK